MAQTVQQRASSLDELLRTRAILDGMIAQATNPPMDGANINNHGVAQPTPTQAVNPAVGDGGNGGSPPSNNGGGGNGGDNGGNARPGFFSHPKWRNPNFLIAAIATTLGTFALVLSSVKTDPNHQHDAMRDVVQAETNAKISETSGMAPPGWVSTGRNGSAAIGGQSTSSTKTIAYTEPFDCPPKEVQGEERTRIFDAHKVSTTEAGQVLHVDSRCSVVRIKEPVTELQGSDYVFAIPDPDIPGNFWKCGTFGGFHNTLTECRDMLNRHPGLNVRFGVGEGEVVLK